MPEGWLFLGIARQRAGQLKRAAWAFRRALRLQPEFAEAHNRIGALLASGGRGRAGYTHLRRAVELAPGEAAAWIHLAQVCNNLGRREEGLEALARAEKLGGYEEQVETVKRLFSA